MRKDTVTTTVYEFKELSDDVQEKVIENLWDINVDYEWWDYDCLMHITDNEIENMKLTSIEESFLDRNSLFNSTIQAFDIDRDNFIQMDIEVNDEEIFRKFLGISEKLWDNCYYEFSSGTGRYSDTHMEITENDPSEDEFTTDDITVIERADDIINEKILDALWNLRETYEYLTSREAIVETIEANEYEFTKSGRIY